MKKQSFIDIPMFELKAFELYEINKIGLDSKILGTQAKRYTNRYEVSNIDYTDNTQEYIVNLRANEGIYKGDIVNLKGNVVYTREDGLIFKSEIAVYNKQTSVVSTKTKYHAYNENNTIVGSSLKYNNLLNKIESKNVTSIYQLREN